MSSGVMDPESGQSLKRFEAYALLNSLSFEDYFHVWTGGGVVATGFFDRWPIVLCAMMIGLFALCVGHGLLDAIGVSRCLNRLEQIIFSLGVGFNAIAILMLVSGLFGLLRFPAIYIGTMVSVFVFSACRLFVRWRRTGRLTLTNGVDESSAASGNEQAVGPPVSTPDQVNTAPETSTDLEPVTVGPWGKTWVIWFAMAVLFSIVSLLGAMLPPWEFDVREYHLQVPKEWYLQQGISYLPHNIYGNMPLGAEIHALLAMVLFPGQEAWWWGALTGKTIMGAFAPLTALAIFAFGKRFATVNAGAIAALIYISTPWVIKNSFDGMNEGAVSFFMMTAFYATVLWATHFRRALRTSDASRNEFETGLLALAGFLAGSAVACKYPALLYSVIPLASTIMFWPVLSSMLEHRFQDARKGQSGEGKGKDDAVQRTLLMRSAILFLIAVAIGCGPWFIKNLWLTGNPTYPLLSGWFGGRTAEQVEQWRVAHGPGPYSSGELVAGFRTLLVGSTWLGPTMIPFAVMAVFTRRLRVLTILLLLMVIFVFSSWWFATHRIERFLVPLLPFLAVLAGTGAIWSCHRFWRRATAFLLTINVLLCLQLVVGPVIIRSDQRFFVAIDELRAGVALENDFFPARVSTAHRLLNSKQDEVDRVLLVGDAQPFDLEVPLLYNTCFDDDWFELLFKGRTRAERLAGLRRLGVSHLLINWSEIRRYRSTYGYSDYISEALIRDELVGKQKLLRPLPFTSDREQIELFEVVYE